MGGLCAELVTFQEGIYIVRAVVTVDAVALTSGLAAAAHLEQAEDQARYRALHALGLWDDTPAIAGASLGAAETAPLPSSPAKTVEPPPAVPVAPSPLASVEPIKVEPIEPDAAERPSTPVASIVDTPEIDTPEIDTPEIDIPEVDTPDPSDPFELDPVAPAIKAAAIAQLPDMSGGPVDLSDIMAQTDVELRRLGWSVGKGREYLEKTYGKRSRHELTDEELLAFLLYLETLPDPAGSRLS